jgi:multicomponent Na+:H+ antiporter subunit D
MLIWIGVTMTAFPIFYAVIENDLRRVLSYSLNNQLGFMVVGIGIGTELSLNGTAAHAFCHILYKALLFMSMGAVLYRTGTVKGSELGGLYRSMPLSAVFCMVGAASISALPLFSGFISKSLVISATGDGHYVVAFVVLLFASAGVVEHAGIKVPYFSFFSHDSGIRCKEAPPHMLLAMGLTAFLCIGIGIFPQPLYRILPYSVDFHPYTATHVMAQLQLLLFFAFCFGMMNLMRLYPPELRSTNLDTDWIYRRALPVTANAVLRVARLFRIRAVDRLERTLTRFVRGVYRAHGPEGLWARTWPTGSTVLWIAIILAAYLLIYYL